MVYIIIGPSCAGKSAFVSNSFIRGRTDYKQYKDIVDITEFDDCILVGKYFIEDSDINKSRRQGTDNIARQYINLIKDEIEKHYRYKDIIIEGDKICSHSMMDFVMGLPCEKKLFYVKCSPEESYRRNMNNGSNFSFAHLKALATKANNIFIDYCNALNGEIVETEELNDFSKLSKDTFIGLGCSTNGGLW